VTCITEDTVLQVPESRLIVAKMRVEVPREIADVPARKRQFSILSGSEASPLGRLPASDLFKAAGWRRRRPLPLSNSCARLRPKTDFPLFLPAGGKAILAR